jgi:DNA-binding response OmpR family regulator
LKIEDLHHPVSSLTKGGYRGGKENNPQFQTVNSDFVEIIVANTGPGIPIDCLDKIFDRFYQLDNSSTRKQEGTGIGLALTRELVKRHHGEISVQRTPNEKTSFIVQLPLGKDHFNEEEILKEMETVDRRPETEKQIQSVSIPGEDIGSPMPDPKRQSEVIDQSPVSGLQSPLILIVEDNADMRQYIHDRLETNYSILESENGESGCKIAVDKIPDLIISDVMMPKMDGFELCRKLKTDERTSHIPIILLTARVEIKDRIKGLETGADDYIAKPFDADELEVKIKNLITQRRKLRERFSRIESLTSKDIAVSSMDEKFLKRSIHIIEEHLTNPDFSVAQFSREIGMSRWQLNRKIRALTNHSVSQFICLIKLQRAIQFLVKNAGTVAEIAFSVGFSSPSYFNKCFRDHFKMSPLQYISHQSDKL